MRVSRIYCDHPLGAEKEIVLNDKSSHYLIQVLRHKPGDSVTLFNGDGHNYKATITTASKKKASILIDEASSLQPISNLNIHLAIGISKGDRFDQALQKATELGVNKITPLFTEYTNVKLSSERLAKKLIHWQGIIIAACEQSGRCYIPKLDSPCNLTQWVTQSDSHVRIILSPRAVDSLPQVNVMQNITILVGPEGGLSGDEEQQCIDHDFHPVKLGNNVLRTETAPLAAIAAAQTLWGDFK